MWWTAISIWPLPPGGFDRIRRSSRCRPAVRRAICLRVSSCWPRRSRDGRRSSGRWRTTDCSPSACARNSGCRWCLNGPPGAPFSDIEPAIAHYSGLPGLIDATRRATAVVGVDSGPLHLAAALGKPGVAIFGPTDPSRNGPYGNSLRVLRSAAAVTTYKRGAVIDESMRNISPDEVFEPLKTVLECRCA